jgi:hypothetical protein
VWQGIANVLLVPVTVESLITEQIGRGFESHRRQIPVKRRFVSLLHRVECLADRGIEAGRGWHIDTSHPLTVGAAAPEKGGRRRRQDEAVDEARRRPPGIGQDLDPDLANGPGPHDQEHCQDHNRVLLRPR